MLYPFTNTKKNTRSIKRFLCLALTLVLVMSCLPVSIIAQAAASDYIAASYASNLNVVTKVSTGLKAEPNNSASNKYTVTANNTLSVQALHKNSSGGYWYQINYYGTTGYVDSGYVSPVNYRYDDISILSPTMDSDLPSGYPREKAG